MTLDLLPHCGLTVPPLDPKALAEAIIKSRCQKRIGRRWAAAAGRFVEEYHAIPVLADKL